MQNKRQVKYLLSYLREVKTSSFNIIFKSIIITSILIVLQGGSSYAQPLASGKNKYVGNIIGNAFNIRSDFLKYWNQVTPENASKWGSVEGTPGGYNWTQLDMIYNFAMTNNLPFKHHTLVWGQQYPSFVATLDSASLYQRIEAWIKICGEKYPKAAMVDVVNEPLHAFTGTASNLVKALGGGGKTGWDWVVKAFELARKYWSPSTKLILNDYNIINSVTSTNDLIKIVNVLKDKKLIDGIGIQAHGFEIDGPAVSTLQSNLRKLSATGIPVYITEFDISSTNDEQQLQKYKAIFPAIYEEPGVVGITLWGYVYNQIWRADAYLINDRNAERPALQWLRNYLKAPFRPIAISPVATTNEVRNPKLLWHPSETATSYHLQLSDNRSMTSFLVDTTIADTSFQLKTLNGGTAYYWHISAKNSQAEGEFTDTYSFITINNAASVDEEMELPGEFKLMQNYPNPFNPSTNIRYQLAKACYVTLKVYDVIGNEIATLVDKYQQAGIYDTQLTIQNSQLSSGIYFYTLKAGEFTQTKKLVLLR